MSKPIVASYCTTFLKAEMLHIYRQVAGLSEFETFVLTKQRLNADKFPFHDIEVVRRMRKNFIRRYYLKHIKHEPAIVYRGEFQGLSKILNRRRVDLMHVYFGHTAVHLLPFIEAWEKPCVVSFHGADVMLEGKREGYAEDMRRMLEIVPLVMVRSESLKERVIGLGCAPEKIRLNRTGIPLELYPFLERTAPENGAWHIVQACRLIGKKGLKTAFRAFTAFSRKFPEARFTLAGEGPMEKELRVFAAELGIADRVEFRGFLSQEELNALYRSAHIFCHPSQLTSDQNQEGVPNSMLEAMSTGLPVASTLHGGIPEAVEHEKAGFLVEERDHDALSKVFFRYAENPSLWQSMGRAASESVNARFEQGKQVAKLESYYREVIDK